MEVEHDCKVWKATFDHVDETVRLQDENGMIFCLKNDCWYMVCESDRLVELQAGSYVPTMLGAVYQKSLAVRVGAHQPKKSKTKKGKNTTEKEIVAKDSTNGSGIENQVMIKGSSQPNDAKQKSKKNKIKNTVSQPIASGNSECLVADSANNNVNTALEHEATGNSQERDRTEQGQAPIVQAKPKSKKECSKNVPFPVEKGRTVDDEKESSEERSVETESSHISENREVENVNTQEKSSTKKTRNRKKNRGKKESGDDLLDQSAFQTTDNAEVQASWFTKSSKADSSTKPIEMTTALASNIFNQSVSLSPNQPKDNGIDEGLSLQWRRGDSSQDCKVLNTVSSPLTTTFPEFDHETTGSSHGRDMKEQKLPPFVQEKSKSKMKGSKNVLLQVEQGQSVDDEIPSCKEGNVETASSHSSETPEVVEVNTQGESQTKKKRSKKKKSLVKNEGSDDVLAQSAVQATDNADVHSSWIPTSLEADLSTKSDEVMRAAASNTLNRSMSLSSNKLKNDETDNGQLFQWRREDRSKNSQVFYGVTSSVDHETTRGGHEQEIKEQELAAFVQENPKSKKGTKNVLLQHKQGQNVEEDVNLEQKSTRCSETRKISHVVVNPQGEASTKKTESRQKVGENKASDDIRDQVPFLTSVNAEMQPSWLPTPGEDTSKNCQVGTFCQNVFRDYVSKLRLNDTVTKFNINYSTSNQRRIVDISVYVAEDENTPVVTCFSSESKKKPPILSPEPETENPYLSYDRVNIEFFFSSFRVVSDILSSIISSHNCPQLKFKTSSIDLGTLVFQLVKAFSFLKDRSVAQVLVKNRDKKSIVCFSIQFPKSTQALVTCSYSSGDNLAAMYDAECIDVVRFLSNKADIINKVNDTCCFPKIPYVGIFIKS